MSTIEKSIEVNVPAETAYNQWTQFKDFPRFMEGVEEVREVSDKHLHRRVNIGGKEKEFDTEITEQIPGKRIAWRSIGGTDNGGVVTFHHLTSTTSRIMVQMGYQPEGWSKRLATFWALRHTASTVDSSASKNTSKEAEPHRVLGVPLSAMRSDNPH